MFTYPIHVLIIYSGYYNITKISCIIFCSNSLDCEMIVEPFKLNCIDADGLLSARGQGTTAELPSTAMMSMTSAAATGRVFRLASNGWRSTDNIYIYKFKALFHKAETEIRPLGLYKTGVEARQGRGCCEGSCMNIYFTSSGFNFILYNLNTAIVTAALQSSWKTISVVIKLLYDDDDKQFMRTCSLFVYK